MMIIMMKMMKMMLMMIISHQLVSPFPERAHRNTRCLEPKILSQSSDDRRESSLEGQYSIPDVTSGHLPCNGLPSAAQGPREGCITQTVLPPKFTLGHNAFTLYR